MLDRRLMQDDNRGLFQGVQDNQVTPHHFVLLLERQISGSSVEASSLASYPSLLGHAARHSLLNPLHRLIHKQGFTAAYRPLGMTCATNGGKINLDELFPELYSTSVKQMSLSLMYDGMKMEKSFTVSIHPMEMYSFLLSR